jgi:ubiquinone/menaquinone biosynthesis C-methylase UbiE
MDAQMEALQEARLEGWGEINRYRLRAVLRHAGTSLLDVGCSTGAYVAHLNGGGYDAYGIDLLADAAWMQGVGYRCVQGAAVELPFADEAFDTVLAFEVLEHIPELHKGLAELYRVCRQNVILSVPDCETPEDILRAGMTYAHWRDRTHRHFFTQDSLRKVLEQTGFQVESTTRINPILPDFLVLRSLYVPFKLAYFASRVLRRLPFRKKYCMTLLAIAKRI